MLKVNLNNMKSVDASVSTVSHSNLVFLKKNTSSVVTDDLNVIPVKLDLNTSITLLKFLGVEYSDLLEERNMDFGLEEEQIKPLIFFRELGVFLTIPLGKVKHLTMDNSSSTGIDNMYNCIPSLGEGKYLKSEEIKSMLLVGINQGSFFKEQATFIVSDDLEVTVSPSISISTISKFNTLGIPVGDIEVMEVSIGEQEALLILKASLTSTTALTDCFNSFKNAKSLI
ncbi:hypothetical protein L1987_21654 [Smallanthus sonchifolius]|uniref:Uncharacterized protein n=1 Tax=Smallanthus sonchifolius TaxID=185202 RepID=A0ACB9IDM5_9ASTR|nr:hypothetical protein L1987_21654 [Smallanthus sonchifolius]